MTEARKAGALPGGVLPDGALPDPALPDRAGHIVPARPGDVPSLGRSTGLSEQTQMRLGNHLRTLYDNVLHQPVPDRFRDLIDRLGSDGPDKP